MKASSSAAIPRKNKRRKTTILPLSALLGLPVLPLKRLARAMPRQARQNSEESSRSTPSTSKWSSARRKPYGILLTEASTRKHPKFGGCSGETFFYIYFFGGLECVMATPLLMSPIYDFSLLSLVSSGTILGVFFL